MLLLSVAFVYVVIKEVLWARYKNANLDTRYDERDEDQQGNRIFSSVF